MRTKPYATSESIPIEILEQASSIIDGATFNRIENFDDLTEFQQEMVRRATLEQASFIDEYGGSSDISSIGVGGDFSISFTSGSSEKYNGLCENSFNYLRQTGLMRRVL